MKLRLRDNSIRLRLSQGEVATLCKSGLVSGKTGFPDDRSLTYVIESSPASVAPAAFFADATITLRLPESSVLAWSSSEQVSIEGEQRLDDGKVLTLLVEKDFACLVPRPGEDEADLYPHPATGRSQC